MGAATAPPLPCWAVTDRASPCGRPAGWPPRHPAPAAGAGSRRRGRRPIRRALRHAAEREATKAHRLLALGVPAKEMRHARRPNSAAGRRGRRRSAYEAPRAAADRGTRLGGAESKRRRRSRLPAPPSRVTLLVRNLEQAQALAKALQREAPHVVEAERLPGGELAHHVRDQDLPGPGPRGDPRRGLHGGAEEVRVL